MGDKNVGKVDPTPKGDAPTVRADLTEYFKHEDNRDKPGEARAALTSGESLKKAAEAYENTLRQDQHVHDLAAAIRNGQPGTPEWDKLMKTVEAQLNGNNETAKQVSDGMGHCAKKVLAINDQNNTHTLLQGHGDAHISMST